jgi:hypothetical protein
MSNLTVPLAAHVVASGVLTLVMPVAVVIVVAIWYFRLWSSGMGER